LVLASVDPSTGKTLRTFTPLTPEETDERLRCAQQAFAAWRRVPVSERARLLARAADLLEADRDAFARTMTQEMGKPIRAAVEEAVKSARGCRYYAEHGPSFLADEVVATEATRSFVRYQPLGPILAVMPWNFPFWQVFRFAAPALVAGNVGLLKHASNVPQCALAIEDVFRRAGAPNGVFQTLLIESRQVQGVIADDRVVAVTLTGSEPAGAAVAAEAGRRIKKTVLELGGSDPFVVLPSADLDLAATTAVTARTINNGQSCIAAKRFIVHERVADEFERRFVAGLRTLRVGDPLDPETDVGPLATADILATLDEQVQTSVAAGARVLVGGHRLQRAGNYYAPTALGAVPEDSPAACDELFGPVAALFRVRDADDALRLANNTAFGLGASVWTRDASERDRFVDELAAGLVFVNGMVASDPRLPFGGIKRSGYGRELSAQGLREFVNVKTVWIREGEDSAGGQATRTE
jgi:succinate-semialdehyde dehydrogenase/glutarate-semialdehyde dehydrogenase